MLELELERRHELEFWFTKETEAAFGNAVAITISAEGDPTPPAAPLVSKLTHSPLRPIIHAHTNPNIKAPENVTNLFPPLGLDCFTMWRN